MSPEEMLYFLFIIMFSYVVLCCNILTWSLREREILHTDQRWMMQCKSLCDTV